MGFVHLGPSIISFCQVSRDAAHPSSRDYSKQPKLSSAKYESCCGTHKDPLDPMDTICYMHIQDLRIQTADIEAITDSCVGL